MKSLYSRKLTSAPLIRSRMVAGLCAPANTLHCFSSALLALSWIVAVWPFMAGPALAQVDTTTHGWPVTPFSSTHPITGVFCEFRNTLTSDHFHNGVDIPKPDGTPVYPVYDGVVTAIGTTANSGDNAYVRVRYTVSGLTKSDAYVHINPNPLLYVGGPVVAYQTVLGTILPGLGHVHFTHGLSGAEMNAIRPVGGFAPYIDNYPPRIMSVRFFLDESATEFLGGRLSGPVDIRVHIQETNAATPADVSISTSNNGTYIVGYRILSADRQTTVYEPPSAGVRFRFDRQPTNNDVHRAFAPGADLSTHIYTITNGNGADAVNTTRTVPNNFLNTETLPVGAYTVMVFSEDTRGLTDAEYLPVTVERGDLVAPAAPVLKAVLNDSTNRVTISWYPNTEPDLLGYRLFYSIDGTIWTQRENETRLTGSVTSISYNNISGGRTFFRLAAVDSASPTNVSQYSDVYGLRLNSSTAKTLIVDGFDRTEGSGSYHQVSHPFVMTHGFSVAGDFSSCANEALLDGSVALGSYAEALWVLGDESTSDETFSSAEQALVKVFLQQGGKLCVSGSEIGYDLDRASGPAQSDRDFLHDFLKTAYVADDANDPSVKGVSGSVFQGFALRYGVIVEGAPYEEDWPDVLAPVNGADVSLSYGVGGAVGAAGVTFQGVFPGGVRPGAVMVLGFPFETITERGKRDSLMARIFTFFGGVSGVDHSVAPPPVATLFGLEQNYPNPFNPATRIRYSLPFSGSVLLTVYDVLGREVSVLVNEAQEAGPHEVSWEARNVSSGVYYCRLMAGASVATRTMTVLK